MGKSRIFNPHKFECKSGFEVRVLEPDPDANSVLRYLNCKLSYMLVYDDNIWSTLVCEDWDGSKIDHEKTILDIIHKAFRDHTQLRFRGTDFDKSSKLHYLFFAIPNKDNTYENRADAAYMIDMIAERYLAKHIR